MNCSKVLYFALIIGASSAKYCSYLPSQRCSKLFVLRGGENGESNNDSVSGTATIEDVESISSVEEEKVNLESLRFSASVQGDGSESDIDAIPTRFLNMQKGNREKAKQAFGSTVKWREDQSMNDILSRPNPKFDLCKKVFPVFLPGKDQTGNVVVVQRVGLIDFDYGTKNALTSQDILMYYLYIIEYIWNILEIGHPHAVMTTVMDLKGVKLSTFRNQQKRQFLLKFVKVMSDHYPNRSYKTLIINAPSWINMAYRLVKPLLRESTKKKIMLLNGGKKQDDILIETLGSAVPKELLEDRDDAQGEENFTHESSSIENEIRLLCLSVLEINGINMAASV
uniref:CRAL-TRIO domain-containing protein n=1 Tax=Chaetoceros debilis TaxID=122233 RepID=A0A7S3V4M9_9STRA|mmetsp:Transcript_20205/g.29742  ORF Transcript_20205/g.29742 Transcript_20205/m.29742 type:complete len:339 (+) Transcript_20205:108-1124(+)